MDTPHEALSASLNRYGAVNLDYMESLSDNSKDELVELLKGQIYFNPLVDNYEIKDRFIAGNVMERRNVLPMGGKQRRQRADAGGGSLALGTAGRDAPRDYV